MFDYNPDDASKCWPAGDYEATLESATEGTSKKGNPMLTVKWRLYSGSKTQLLDDWIVNPSTVWKLREIAVALDMKDEFESREFDLSECRNATLLVHINVKESEKYGKQNQIGQYKKLDRASFVPPAEDVIDDDEEVPF